VGPVSDWSVEAAPGAVATQVGAGVFKLPVTIFLDYKLVTATELTLTAEQIELMFGRGLIGPPDVDITQPSVAVSMATCRAATTTSRPT
jgi:hypothetical protein